MPHGQIFSARRRYGVLAVGISGSLGLDRVVGQEPQRRRCLARFLLQLLEDLLRRQPLTLGVACIHFKTSAWN